MPTGISQTLSTGEILRWDIDRGECAVLRETINGEEFVVVIEKIHENKVSLSPRDGINLITPHCLKKVNELFPGVKKKLGFSQGPKKPFRRNKNESKGRAATHK